MKSWGSFLRWKQLAAQNLDSRNESVILNNFPTPTQKRCKVVICSLLGQKVWVPWAAKRSWHAPRQCCPTRQVLKKPPHCNRLYAKSSGVLPEWNTCHEFSSSWSNCWNSIRIIAITIGRWGGRQLRIQEQYFQWFQLLTFAYKFPKKHYVALALALNPFKITKGTRRSIANHASAANYDVVSFVFSRILRAESGISWNCTAIFVEHGKYSCGSHD